MYMSTHYMQNTVPNECAFYYAKLCTRNKKFNAVTTCRNVNDLLKNNKISLGKIKLWGE